MAVKFNAKKFQQGLVNQVNEKGRNELLSRLPDELRKRLLASGTILTLDALVGKLRLSGGDSQISAEAMEIWTQKTE
jgi:hypothetical protein